MEDLEAECHSAMLAMHNRANMECAYNATPLLAVLEQHGGLKTGQILLGKPEPLDSYATVWQHKHLDLAVEHLVHQDRFQELFTQEELQGAHERLREHGYTGHLSTPDV